MISILKYLNGPNSRTAMDPASSKALCGLVLTIFEALERDVLTGDGSEALRRRLGEAAEALEAGFGPQQIAAAEAAVSQILAEHHRITQESSVAQAVEVQHIVAMLNQALIVLAQGRDRSVSRLNEIQGALQRTSMLRDIFALKTALGETIRFVEAESRQAQQTATEELARFEVAVSRARDFVAHNNVELAPKADGVSKISECIRALSPGQAVYALAYLSDQLHGLAQRYGPAVAEELIFRLIKERIQPIAPSCSTFRWSRSTLVGIFTRPRNLAALQDEVSALNRAPVLHHVKVGGRTAVLTIAPSHLVAEATESAQVLVDQLDKFAGAHG